MAGRASKEEIRDKAMQIETWAYRLKHLNEVVSPDNDKLKSCVKHIRYDLEDLEVMLGVD